MKSQKEKEHLVGFTGYEDARKKKSDAEIKAASPKAVKAALNRINPDDHNQERG